MKRKIAQVENTSRESIRILHAPPNENNNTNEPWLLDKQAISELLENRNPEDDNAGPLQVGGNISRSQFIEEWPTDNDKQCHLIWENGSIFITELPTDKHERVSDEFRALLRAATPGLYGNGSATYGPPNGWLAEADASFVPRGVPNPGRGQPNAANSRGNAWPTLVLEVGWSESLQSLRTSAARWLGAGTGVQIVITIKLYPERQDGTKPMVAIRWIRANPNVPDWIISFGTADIAGNSRNTLNGYGGAQVTGVGAGGVACNQAGLAAYQLHIPHALLYTGDPNPPNPNHPNPPPGHYDIDLFNIQDALNHLNY